MSVQFCLILLALSSLTAASDPDCDELRKPLEDRSRVVGKWIFQAGSSDNKNLLTQLRVLNSSWIELSRIPDSDDMTLHWADKVNGKCLHGTINSTFSENSTKVTFHFNSSIHEHVGKHLVTCPDCIVWTDTTTSQSGNGETTKGRNIYLFTRTGVVDASDLENFKKQAACLNFPPEFHFGETTDLCTGENAKEEEE